VTYAAIVLAAGHARRFGADKLLRELRGAPIVAHAIRAARGAPVSRIVIVKRPGAALDRICRDAASDDARVQCIDVESEALSASLQAGLRAAGEVAGVFVFLGDMPLIPAGIADQLAAHLGDRFAAVPTHEAAWGHPVLLSARAAALAMGLSGDQGAGGLLRQHAADVVRIETDADGVLLDIDTLADLDRLSLRGRQE
jgi:molybdenum cofactor cytidylyltransferase